MPLHRLHLIAATVLFWPAIAVAGLAESIALSTGMANPAPATSQEGVSRDPLKVFQAIVAGYTAFFSSNQKLLYVHASSESPSGKLAYVLDYMGKDISYDVRKSDSLVSPFTAYIQLSLSSTRNGSCGTVTAYQKRIGWPDAAGALAHVNSVTCFKPLFDDEEYWDRVRFQYAYQDEKWAFVQVIRTEYAKPELPISAASGRAASGLASRDPAAMAFNKAWADTVNPSQP